ncbi:MAG: phosphopantetheine-binding protein, partial [Actinomycetes bacterium]
AEPFAAVLANRVLRAPELPVFANRTAERYPGHAEGIRAELAAQLAAPVRFAEQIEAMYSAGARIFVEAGPGSVLTALVSATLGARPHRAVALDGGLGAGLRGYLRALAHLAVAGVEVRTGWLFAGRDAIDVSGTTPPKHPGWTVDGQLVRTLSGDIPTGALTPARPLREAILNHRGGTGNVQGARNGAGGTPDEALITPSEALVTPSEALITEFLRAGRDMIAAQRDVLLTYLGGGTEELAARSPSQPAPTRVSASQTPDRPMRIVPVLGPTAAHPTPVGGSSRTTDPGGERRPPPPTPTSPAEIAQYVVEVIAERTGYPADMISPELDLEADLSVDSIKRVEIAGKLVHLLDLTDPASAGTRRGAALADAELEELSKIRSVDAITSWLVIKIGGAAATSRSEAPASTQPHATQPHATQPPAPTGSAAPRRMVLREVELVEPARAAGELTGQRFVLLAPGEQLVPERSVIEKLVTGLTDFGAEVTVRDSRHELGAAERGVSGVIHLDALIASDASVLPESFPALRAALAATPRRLILASPGTATGQRADGLRGFVRTVAREYPHTVVRIVEVDPARPARALADALITELLTDSEHRVVRSDAGSRRGLELVTAPLDSSAVTGAEPSAAAAAIGLDRESVVLLVGGGRGIG